MKPAQDKKLTLVIRLEPGCLGPNGAEVIADFCQHAQAEMASLCADIIDWCIEPRHDKSLSEMDYFVAGKRLDKDKATTYLKVFKQSLAGLEIQSEEKLADLINRYLGY